MLRLGCISRRTGMKNLEMKEHKNNNSKTPKQSPKPSSMDTFVQKPSKSSNEQSDNQSRASSEAEDQECDTLATLLAHINTAIIENIE